MSRVFSIGQVSKELGADAHRIRYAIESRKVRSVARVGNTHCYDEDALAQIKAALAEIGARGTEDGEASQAAPEREARSTASATFARKGASA